MPKPKTESVRIRLSPEHRRRYQKAADLLDIDLSRFMREAADNRIEQMRAEGKKV